MKLFVDECVWEVTRVFVQQLDHELATVEERLLSGADDEIVLGQAVSENRAFLTRDMHYLTNCDNLSPLSKFHHFINPKSQIVSR